MSTGMETEICDRCKTKEYLFTYGYSKVGFHLCKKCAREWENFIQKIRKEKFWTDSKWCEEANELLTDFVLFQLKEKVSFT